MGFRDFLLTGPQAQADLDRVDQIGVLVGDPHVHYPKDFHSFPTQTEPRINTGCYCRPARSSQDSLGQGWSCHTRRLEAAVF